METRRHGAPRVCMVACTIVSSLRVLLYAHSSLFPALRAYTRVYTFIPSDMRAVFVPSRSFAPLFSPVAFYSSVSYERLLIDTELKWS